jgi:DNA (cytosine-5)-methyltransferase 1
MIKVLELFSGYGGASFGLSMAKIPHKCIGYSDIEDCANYIFALNHGNNIPQLGDITKINPDELEDFDLLTGGFPCQSFSLAGKREGFKAKDKGNLFFEIIRLADVKKPRWMLLENVQGLLSHDNGETFKVILRELKRIGYYVNWKLMFSKNHGTPQNRPRVWLACFRELSDYEKFVFPQKEKLVLSVKDLLEDVVDDKYYLNESQLKKIEEGIKKENYNFYKPPENLDKPLSTLKAHMGVDTSDVPYFQVADFRYDEGVRVRKDGTCPTIKSRDREQDLSGMPIIYNPFNNYTSNTTIGTLGTSSGTVTGKQAQIINTITTGYGRQGSSSEFIAINKQMKEYTNNWRRLTPRECFRLMGFFNDEIKLGDLKDSKLYFLAGNGWDVNVAHKIFIQMFKGNLLNEQKTLGAF